MIGHVDLQEARIWLQTTEPATVQMTYRRQDGSGATYSTAPMQTTWETACTATLVADSVRPGTTYTYTVAVNGAPCPLPHATTFRTQPIWKWRSDDYPTASLMIGSCFYVNEDGYERHRNGVESGYGSEFEILDAMTRTPTDAMLWLGDNVYLREPDWNSRSGILRRYAHTRAYAGLQPFLASRAHYAIWDDHDYGPNNSNTTFWGKHHALEAHRLFWPNPSVGMPEFAGITTTFELLDMQVFLLDDRWYRTPENVSGEQRILGQDQVNWLIGALASSTATFKIVAVGSQVLSTDTRKEGFVHAAQERDRLIAAITENKISGVIFVSGDIHAAELSRLDRPGTYPLYEFTSSALTAGSNTGIANQPNDRRVEGTAYGEHNYGTLSVSGKRKQRVLTLTLHDRRGNVVWTRAINEQDLR
jgi:alkaline phosphatase D